MDKVGELKFVSPAVASEASSDLSSQEVFAMLYPQMAQAFNSSWEEQYKLITEKMLDYGIGNMKAGTELKTEEEIRFALMGIWFRISDKMARWQNLLRTEKEPNCESLYDTFMDVANYAIFAKLISRGLWSGK